MKTIYTYVYKDGKIERKETLVNETKKMYRVASDNDWFPVSYCRQIAKSEIPKLEIRNFSCTFAFITDDPDAMNIAKKAFRNHLIEEAEKAKIELEKAQKRIEEFDRAVME